MERREAAVRIEGMHSVEVRSTKIEEIRGNVVRKNRVARTRSERNVLLGKSQRSQAPNDKVGESPAPARYVDEGSIGSFRALYE